MTHAIAGARVCSTCAYTNFGAQASCLNCEAPLPALGVELPGTVLVASERASRACPSCGIEIGVFDRFCAACGARLD